MCKPHAGGPTPLLRRLQRLEGIVRAIAQGQGVDAASVSEASRAVAALRQSLQDMQQGQVGGAGVLA